MGRGVGYGPGRGLSWLGPIRFLLSCQPRVEPFRQGTHRPKPTGALGLSCTGARTRGLRMQPAVPRAPPTSSSALALALMVQSSMAKPPNCASAGVAQFWACPLLPCETLPGAALRCAMLRCAVLRCVAHRAGARFRANAFSLACPGQPPLPRK